MTFEVKPYSSVGPIYLGMTKQQVRSLFGSEPDSFQRGGTEDTDYFIDKGILVTYDANELCNSITVVEPSECFFKGENLLKLGVASASDLFKEDSTFALDDCGYTSYLFGIGGYYEDLDEMPEGIIVFKKGYYEDLKP